MSRFVRIACVFLLATNVYAADKPHVIDVATDSCLEQNPSTAGMLDCFTRAEQEWDNELNRAYKALQAQLKPEAQDALKQTQRVWIAQRDKEFELITAINGQMEGTMWIPIMAGQRVDVVKARAKALQGYIDLLQESAP